MNNQPIGQINYNAINTSDLSTELDIWLAGSQYTNKGYGTNALLTLCNYVHNEFGCTKFMIAPSRRNPWAIKSYQKAGFVESAFHSGHCSVEYEDTVVMIKTMVKQ
ncbi:GNAT family N-acetyltransferase [Larkinella arboricola]